MSNKFTKRISLALIAALVLCAVAGTALAVGGVAFAENTPSETLSFVQMSDIHYFPIDSCYQDVKSEDYETSEFYHSTTGDTKLVLESGVILNGAVQSIINDAKDGNAPMYFIATGDLSKNGERAALIDVANALRFMQNEIRKEQGYENFQVFAQVGNHDLYNTDAALYDPTNGKELVADAVTAQQFALIFAGLGFPNANIGGTDGAFDLTTYLPEEYWYSDYTTTYQASKNAENLKISYYSQALTGVQTATTNEAKLQKYFEIGDGINQLSYAVEIEDSDFGFIMLDSADREATSNGKPVRISNEEFTYLSNTDQVYYAGTEDSINFDSPIAKNAAQARFNAGEPVYRAAKYAHITGGRITENALDWAQHFAQEQHANASNGGEKTLFVAFHHNLLPHFESEDDILKDFTLYNWEYTAKRFLDMGVRYAFTGHQHSSDIASYTDVEGRTIYDTETGSMVSYESPRRYADFARYVSADGKQLSESYKSSIRATEDMREIASIHIDQNVEWDEEAYQTAITAYNASSNAENWQKVLDSNPNFIAYIVAHERLSTRNYNQYIGEEIYTRLVDRVLAHFLNDDMVTGLVNTAVNAVGGLNNVLINGAVPALTGFTMGKDGSLVGFVKYLLDVVTKGLYEDTDNDGIGNYPYKDKTYNGILDYLVAIINDLVDMEFGDPSLKSSNPYAANNKGKLNLKEMAGFIMMAHATGTEVKLTTTDAELQAEYDAIDEEFDDLGSQYGDFAFKNPIDKTYRKRMTAALKDAHEQLVSGKFAGDLVDALLDPLYRNENGLLRRLLTYEINIDDVVEGGYITELDCEDIVDKMSKLPTTFKEIAVPLLSTFGISLGDDFVMPPIDMHKLTIVGLIDGLLPALRPLVGELISFNLSGDTLFEVIDNAFAGYLTDSFLVGLGGIADEIVVTYATDNFPDLADMTDATKPFLVQPHEGYAEGLTYSSELVTPSAVGASFNAATRENGRVPSRLTANFDTADSTGSYTFKFYTDEEIYARFKYKTTENGEWTYLSTSKANANKDDADYFDSSATLTKDGVTLTMLTQTRPAYVPLIDLGLACITHGEIEYDDDTPIKYGERDNAAKGSVIYKNVTTVTLSGLEAGKTYFYDIEGVYGELSFSLAQSLGKDSFTFATAADESVSDFEFLTIADIQGMIQSMYDDSHKAVEALLKDSRTQHFNFLLNAGDMADNGKNFDQWAMALDTYSDLFANTSQFFTAGNHEDGKNAFANYFNYTLPLDDNGKPLQKDITDGAFYSFDYGNSHFTVLNTNDSSSKGLGNAQLKWLKKDLENAQNKRWRFVLMHKSLFSGGSHSYDGEVVAMREQLVPLFNEYNVNIVFAGHDHTYTTTKLLSADGSIVDKPDLSGVRYTGDGVMFVTLGTLGTKFYGYGENPNVTPKFDGDNSVLSTLTSQTFGKVKVSADEIVFTGYMYDPETDSIRVIGEPIVLSASKVLPATAVYGIIGGVVGGVVLAAAIIAIVIMLKKKKAKALGSAPASGNEPSEAASDEQPTND